MGQLNIYGLGKFGVNADKSPVHLEDGELRRAQNAIRNQLGLEGGIEKRPGLGSFNASAAAGSVLGGIGVPILLAASKINGVAMVGGPTTTIYLARTTRAVNMGATQGWYTSTDGFATTPTLITGGTPANPRSDKLNQGLGTNLFAFCNGHPGAAVVINGRMYYPGTNYTLSSTNTPIRAFDGVADYEFASIPFNPAATECVVLSMLAVGETIYLSVIDSIPAGAYLSRVFALDAETGALTQIGAAFGANQVAYALEWHAGQVFCGLVENDVANGAIYRIRPGIDTTWTLDRTMAGSASGVGVLRSFRGELFAGAVNQASSNIVEKRDSVGAWASSTTVGAVNTHATAGIVFNDALYVAVYETLAADARILKYNGSAWSTVYNPAAAVPVLTTAFIYNGVLYFVGGGSNAAPGLFSSTDGTTWTDLSSKYPATTEVPISMVGVIATGE